MDPQAINARKKCADHYEEACPVNEDWREWEGWIVDIIDALQNCSGFSYTLQLPSGINKTNSYREADHDLWGISAGKQHEAWTSSCS